MGKKLKIIKMKNSRCQGDFDKKVECDFYVVFDGIIKLILYLLRKKVILKNL